MAFLLLKDGTKKTLQAERARILYLVQSGELNGTKQQKEYVKGVKKIYLNRNDPNCPESYLRRHGEPVQEELWYQK